VLNRCTLYGNAALGHLSAGLNFNGGAGQGGAIWASGSLAASNSTFAANQAIGGQGSTTIPFGTDEGGDAIGGGLFITNGTAFLVNVTISGNSANAGVGTPPGLSNGGGLGATNSTVVIRNSIVANSSSGGDVFGPVTDAGYNICSDSSANFAGVGSLNQTDPLLSGLSSNGGPTPTMLLLAGSPARDAIPSGFPPVDQRGQPRPQGPAGDIGAVEVDFISSHPVISEQPVGATVRAGADVILRVGVSGTAPLVYQWYKDTYSVVGATGSMLSLTNVQSSAAGTYSVVVTNNFGSATSQGAVLTIDSTPLISSQPTSVLVSPGGNTNFSVSADGPALTYQWWHDNSVVPGATGPILTIASALAGAQGSYSAVVSNFAGSVTSQVATLSFDASALNILVSPKDTTARVGYPANFTVLASGIPPFSYQWQHGGNLLAGATTSALSLPSVGTNDAGAYSVTVSNAYRTVTSPAATLTVSPGPLAPQLAVARVSTTSLTITFDAESGQTYRLFSSTNLVSWSAVATNSSVLTGPLQFIQPIRPTGEVFYRLQIQ
jgi:hypothetical protein